MNDFINICDSFLKNIRIHKNQKEIIEKMYTQESNKIINHNSKDYIKKTLGILATDPGIGKSICILYLIQYNIILPNIHDIISKKNKIIHIRDKNKLHYIHTNIIVVSKLTIDQWKYYITNYTNLTYKVLRERKDIDYNPFFYHDKNIILVTPNLYRSLSTVLNHNFIVSRLIIDDIHILNINHTKEIQSCFTWLISSNVLPILYPNGCFIKHRDKCTKLLPLYKKNFISKHIIDINNNEDIKHLLIQSKNIYLSKNIEHIFVQTSIDFKSFYMYSKYKQFIRNHIQKKSYTKIIELLGISFTQHLKKEVLDICPICYDTLTYPHIVSKCCKKKFCLSCIFNHIIHQEYSKCPTCRNNNLIENLSYIYHDSKDLPLTLLSKENHLKMILSSLHNQNNLVIYKKINKDIIHIDKNYYVYNQNTNYAKLKNMSKKYFTIFIDDITVQYGFNLPKINNIIIMDYQNKPVENLIISKCRKMQDNPIKCYHLYHTLCD